MADVMITNGYQTSFTEDASYGDQRQEGDTLYIRSPSDGEGVDEVAVLRSQAFREGVSQLVQEQLKISSVGDTAGLASSRRRTMTPIADIRGVDTLNYGKGEKVLRCKLASCYRLLDCCSLVHGTHTYVTALLPADVYSAKPRILIAPEGLLYEEVTAASLVKVDTDGRVLDPGSTSLDVCQNELSLHAALYASRDNIHCVVHIASPAAILVALMKSGLLPLCHEAMVLGEVTYCEYDGTGADIIRHALGATSQVLFLRNHGVVVVGETVEEIYRIASNVMTATEAQVNLIPVGLHNMHLPESTTIETAYKVERELPPGVDPSRRWNYGEVEFEGLMRKLDNEGYCTGHVYRDTAVTALRMQRSQSLSSAPGGRTSFFDERAGAISTPLNQLLQSGRRPDRVVSPNMYVKEEEDELPVSPVPGTKGSGNNPKKIYRWVSCDAVSSLPKQRSVSMKGVSGAANKFAPQGINPRELRDKVKEIRKEYFEDTITAGPQSTVLEGVTWEEARRIKEGQPMHGVDNVRVTAASRGIIQRDHQRDALFYKNYTLSNPFESVTEEDLEKYRQDVKKKNKKKGYGTYAESEPEMLSERRRASPVRSSTPPPKPARMSPIQLDFQHEREEPELRSTVRPVLSAQQQQPRT